MQKLLLMIGTVVILIGILLPLLARLKIGQLPGDIFLKRGNFIWYAPITTGLLLSICVSFLIWFFSR